MKTRNEVGYPPRKFDSPEDITIEDLRSGDVVKLIHEANVIGYRYVPKSESAAVVIEMRDRDFDALLLDGSRRGYLEKRYYGDAGLVPYVGDNGPFWNRSNHTQTTGTNVSVAPIQRESAIRIKAMFDKFDDFCRQENLPIAGSTLEGLVLRGFVEHAIRPRYNLLHQGSLAEDGSSS